jgi:ATP-dependent helicase/nuclease subunit A
MGTAAMTNIGEMRKAGCRAASEVGYDARKLPAWYIAGATSFLDWLLMAFGDAPELVPISIRRKEELEEEQFTRVGESGIIRAALSAVPPAVGEPLARWESRLDRGYRYEKATEAKGIWTVSELKEEAGAKEKAEPKEAGTKEEAVAKEEAGAKEQAMVEAAGSHVKAAGKTGGAFRGTVYHRILQNMPPTSDVIAISAWIRQNLPADQAEMVNPDDIAGFYRSRSGSLCLKPGVKRHVEQPFVYGIPESRFIEGRSNSFADWNREPSDADNRLYDDEELILIQGTIDLYLEEEDGITLIDYKTDVVSTERILAAYVVQLRCYAMALSHITGKKIKAIRIYSFHNKCEIEVK